MLLLGESAQKCVLKQNLVAFLMWQKLGSVLQSIIGGTPAYIRAGGKASKCPGHCVNTADCLGHPCYLKVVPIINAEGHMSPLGVDGQLRG